MTALLIDTDSAITDVMKVAGFRTKSDFNREFRLVTGGSQLDFRRRRKADDQASQAKSTISR